MNAQHLSESGEWYTPPEEVARWHRVFPDGFFDPCSSAKAQTIVRASSWSDRGLELDGWGSAAVVNPPGACPRAGGEFSVCGNRTRCSCKLPRRFLERSIIEAAKGCSVLFLSYSVNHVRIMANLLRSGIVEHDAVAVYGAIPLDRIAYLDPVTMRQKRGSNCDSIYWFIAPPASEMTARFEETFSDRQLFAMG